MFGDSDTISAISTAKGIGALSIVRISGQKCAEILEKCFYSKSFDINQSHRAFYGYWKDSKNLDVIDEVIVINYSSGHGFTGEPSAEIICHGGPKVTDMVLESIIDAGARLANPGEFTYRAVMNNKMDLIQAENILEIINAKTPIRVKQSLNNIRGAFSQILKEMEEEHIYLLAHLEASIDFISEDIQPVNFAEIKKRIINLINKMESLLESFIRGQKNKEGLRVAIVGKPNAGKSSLLNALTGKERSIVSALPGTTRDTIEYQIHLGDQILTLIDTAGLREGPDEIEELGIRRTHNEIEVADLVLYILDGSVAPEEEEIDFYNKIPNRKILCINKKDLNQSDKVKEVFAKYEKISISCVASDGMSELLEYFAKNLSMINESYTEVLVSSSRQNTELKNSKKSLEEALSLILKNESPDLVSFELKNSLISLQSILGKNLADDIMDKVFKEFCIGK